VGDWGDALETFRTNRRIWETKNAQATLLREAPVGGVVKISGVLDGDPTLRSALTLRPCIAYRIRCAERRDDLGMIQVFAVGGAHVPFAVVDGEGTRVRIEDEDAIIGAALADVTFADADNDVLASLLGVELAQRAAQAAKRGVGVFYEDCFVPGDRVDVRGVLQETTEVVTTGYRDGVGRGLCLKPAPDGQVVVCRS
jgi:hypothetical protein